jgi:membrane protein
MSRELWTAEPDPESLAGRALAWLRFVVMVAEGVVRANLLLRASALTYFTVLSLIPLIALVVAIVGSLGLGDQLVEDLVSKLVGQLAAGSPEAQAKILEIVAQVNLRALGTLGAATLLVTTVLALGNVEQSFNAIWGVAQDRSWSRRFPDYLAVLVVAPVLAGSALSLAGSLESQWMLKKLVELPLFSTLYDIGLKQLPLVVLAFAFGFLYWFLPNTRVKISSALIGGLVAAALVILAQNLYLGLQVGVARSSALFGGLAMLPLLFVWMYFFWAIVLLGAEVAFALQHLETYRIEVHGGVLDPAQRESVGLRIALEVARAFRDGAAVWELEELARLLGVPVRSARSLLTQLEGAGIVAPMEESRKEGGYLLARPAERIRVADVLGALRGQPAPQGGDRAAAAGVERVMAELAEGAGKGAAGRTIAELLVDVPPLEEAMAGDAVEVASQTAG